MAPPRFERTGRRPGTTSSPRRCARIVDAHPTRAREPLERGSQDAHGLDEGPRGQRQRQATRKIAFFNISANQPLLRQPLLISRPPAGCSCHHQHVRVASADPLLTTSLRTARGRHEDPCDCEVVRGPPGVCPAALREYQRDAAENREDDSSRRSVTARTGAARRPARRSPAPTAARSRRAWRSGL